MARAQGYWDQLQTIKNAADILQRCPIPRGFTESFVLTERLENAFFEIGRMVDLVAADVTVWEGQPDGASGNVILASEWNSLIDSLGLSGK